MPKTKRSLTRAEKIDKHTRRAIKTGKLSEKDLNKLISQEKRAREDELLETTLKDKR